MTTQIPNVIKKILMIIMGFVLSFVIVELLTKIFVPQSVGSPRFAYNKELGYIPMPHQHGRSILIGAYDYSYTHNAQGLRNNKNYSYQKTIPRILFLGDSFTYGIGVNDNETFSHLVQGYFNNNVEAINAGNPGKGTDYALKFFQTMGKRLKPDVVAIMFFHNDFVDNGREEYFAVGANDNLKPKSITEHKNVTNLVPGYDWFLSWSHFANFVKKEIVLFVFPPSSPPPSPTPSSNISITYTKKDPMEQWRTITGTYIKLLKDEAEKSGTKLVFFFIPDELDIKRYRDNGIYSNEEQSIADLLKFFSVAFFSLTPVLGESDNDIETLYLSDRHWTAVSHRLTAQYIFQQLVSFLPHTVTL